MKIKQSRRGNGETGKGYVMFGAIDPDTCRKWFERWYPTYEAAERFAAKRGWTIEQ